MNFILPPNRPVGQSLEERRARLSVKAGNEARVRENGYAGRSAPIAALATPPLAKSQGCLWLTEDQPSDLDYCCGAPRVALKPYCEEHQEKAWRKGSNAAKMASAIAAGAVAWTKLRA